MKTRIFIIDDDPDMIEIATQMLKEGGYVVLSDTNPERGLKKVKENPPDLVLLDISMDEMDGLDVCRELKADPQTRGIPIIFVTVKSKESDVVSGLELGAEDYIRKPLSGPELLARIRVVLRRKKPEQGSHIIEEGPLKVDVESYKAWLHGVLLDLTPKQFELLALFMKYEGKVLTRNRISEALWGADLSGQARSMNTTVDQVKQKLGKYRMWVKSLRGVGYRFEIDH
jgi:DNA-binding response OmpR family regulator